MADERGMWLNLKDWFGVSILSKTWFTLTASFPILDFNLDEFIRAFYAPVTRYGRRSFQNSFYRYIAVSGRESFYDYIAYKTSRYCEQNESVHTFNLDTRIRDTREVEIIDRCLGLILMKGVKVLGITVYANSVCPLQKYRLPDLLWSASSLTSLTISSCELPSSLTVDAVKFKSLKVLQLCEVPLDEEVIKCLNASCPLLEELSVDNCSGFKRFCIYGLQNLERIWVSVLGIEKIDIEAPNLRECHIILQDGEGNGKGREDASPSLNLDLCKKTNNVKFSLVSFPDTERIDINTPNLLSFSYSDWPHVFEKNSLPLKACMDCYIMADVDTLWFQKLRRFLDKTNTFKNLKLQISMDSTADSALKLIRSPPYQLEHVELDLFSTVNVAKAVEETLWCCRPRSLTLISDFSHDFEEQSRVVKM
ncbi:F-box domain, Leucine-rich repeat domain, L domain-like protein [Artemisia annua]|uniref:F-box domain, Leucine-rich repeat domain, L domain-like protein n=1 Tax=Artemisia annua TaxID=35608 RepID=A0A2U1MN02_ARTAN|nr:F-box domain, Leucine-rich repeat domain, L domain-like protein [Artemisia annua]